nr:hypothetical protein [Escherichia coli]
RVRDSTLSVLHRPRQRRKRVTLPDAPLSEAQEEMLANLPRPLRVRKVQPDHIPMLLVPPKLYLRLRRREDEIALVGDIEIMKEGGGV